MKGIIIGEVNYPIGSMSIRMRMWAKGFIKNNVHIKIYIVAPRPSMHALKNSEEYITFALSATSRNIKIKPIVYLYQRILGLFSLYKFLRQENNTNFVIITRPNILIGSILLFFCKKNKINFFFDKGDENARLIDKKTNTFIGYLAKLNQVFFNKYIIPKVDVLFVVSSYLENKYKILYPKLRIRRCLPTLIDYSEFVQNQKNNIFELQHKGIEIFKSMKLKVFYAGSCERTNGLFFFLENATKLLIHERFSFEIIFILVDGDTALVKKYCEKLSISEHVTFLNPVLPKYMPAIYNFVDILVLPEQGTIIANAGFPGKTGEYLASGKAILSTIFSDLPDHLINEHNAMLSDIGDSETYTKNFRRLIIDEEFRLFLGRNAIETAKKDFDYKQGILRYIEEL